MNEEKLKRKLAGIDPWYEDFGGGMEHRGQDGMSWYDLSINANSLPCETNLAIIVTSWFGQLKWLQAVLSQYRLSGAFVILAYDNPFYPWMRSNEAEMQRKMPNMNHYILANSVVHKHITYDADKRNGWFWDVRYAQGIIRQFKNIEYVYCTNGDCICENPEGFKDLIALLGEDDVMAGQSTETILHTADVLFKAEAFNKIFDQMAEWFRLPVLGSLSPEGSMMEAIAKTGVKVKHVDKQPLDKDGTVDCYSRYDQESTWKDILGYKNLYAINETGWNDGTMPVDRKYVDDYMEWIYFSGEERETVCRYWDTGDLRYLYQWRDRGEDSWYNRLYYPLEHYGKEPIYETVH
jgi:hypothetical protein